MSKVKQKQIRKRTEIIEKAIPLISSAPFEEISVAAICEAVGISIGTFYHYFQKKSDLLIALLVLIDVYLEEDTYPKLVCEDELENIRLFALGWAEHVESHGLERSKLISSIEPSEVDYHGQKRSSQLKLAEIIARGQTKGQISTELEADTLADLLLLSFRGVSTDWSRHNGSYSIQDKMELFVSLLLRSLKP